MRRNSLLATSAALAALATAAAGVQSAQAASTSGHDLVTRTHQISTTGSLATSAIARPGSHETVTRLRRRGPQGRGRDPATPRAPPTCGSTRSYHGLAVVGGDLVVHRSASGAWQGTQPDPEQALTLSTTPAISAAPACSGLDGRAAGTPKLVVDATGATPRLAWAVTTSAPRSDGTPSRLARTSTPAPAR